MDSANKPAVTGVAVGVLILLYILAAIWAYRPDTIFSSHFPVAGSKMLLRLTIQHQICAESIQGRGLPFCQDMFMRIKTNCDRAACFSLIQGIRCSKNGQLLNQFFLRHPESWVFSSRYRPRILRWVLKKDRAHERQPCCTCHAFPRHLLDLQGVSCFLCYIPLKSSTRCPRGCTPMYSFPDVAATI